MRSPDEWMTEIRRRNELANRAGVSPLVAAKNAVVVIEEAMIEAAHDAFQRAAVKAEKMVQEGRPADEVKLEIETMK